MPPAAFTSLSLAAIAGITAARAPAEQTGSGNGFAPATGDFIQTALSSDAFEIEAGKLALERGTDAVKALAQDMISAHRQTTEELTSLSSRHDLGLGAPALTTAQQSRLDDLSELAGAEFEHLYLEYQEGNHEDALDLLRRYCEAGEHPAVKTWAAETVPKLEHHLEMIRSHSR